MTILARLLLTVLAAFWLMASSAAAADERPLYEKEPYDVITLNEANDSTVLKVRPLDLPDRQLPEKLPTQGSFEVTLLDRPGELYRVQWRSVEKVELFEQLLLEEAKKLVRQRRLDEAFDSFLFLEEHYPKNPTVQKGIEDYFYEEAKALHLEGKYDAALAVLDNLRERNPDRPELENALGMTTDKLVEQHVAEEDYQAARAMVRRLKAIYPSHAVVAKWESSFEEQAGKLLEEARQATKDGRLREAFATGHRMKRIWPKLPGAEEFLRALHEKYSRVVVAVTVPAPSGRFGTPDDWASRRIRRLLYRTITEFAGPGIEGGDYICPMGELEIRELGLQMVFRLQPGVRWSSGDAALTGYDLSQRLLTLADPNEPLYRVQWGELLAGVSVEDVYTVRADLHRPHVRPEALLQATVVPYSYHAVPEESGLTNGPYVAASQTPEEATFLADPRYFALRPTQPKEIAERRFDEGAKAVWDLNRHRVDVLDRVNPWDLDKVRQMKDLVVEPYAMPLLHCLVPNVRKPLLAHQAFRRALVYGIHRQAVLNRLLGGKQRAGCRVVSGPFLPGIARDDPMGYAYDAWIEPRGYEPRLAIALAQIALQEVSAKKDENAGQDDDDDDAPATVPNLVLAHPPHEIARKASTEIQQQLELVGISVTLKELAPGAGSRVTDDVDLVYAELAAWEPVVDARRLLDHDGISGGASPYMTQALRQLDEAPDWIQVGDKLHQVHRLAHQEVALVPLWQMTDHFAYHASLKGVGSRPVSLYQNIENWQPAFHYVVEEK